MVNSLITILDGRLLKMTKAVSISITHKKVLTATSQSGTKQGGIREGTIHTG
jgi:hypothetical protein